MCENKFFIHPDTIFSWPTSRMLRVKKAIKKVDGLMLKVDGRKLRVEGRGLRGKVDGCLPSRIRQLHGSPFGTGGEGWMVDG